MNYPIADTSLAAYASIQGNLPYREQAIMDLLGVEPFTCDEIEVITGWPHQSVSSRIRSLVLQGQIKDSGVRRETRTGRTARVYETKAQAAA